MGMNPDTNRMEQLGVDEDRLRELLAAGKQKELKGELQSLIERAALVRPDGTPVPKHWSIFKLGENVVVNNYTFKIAYIGETSILLEPVAPAVVGENG